MTPHQLSNYSFCVCACSETRESRSVVDFLGMFKYEESGAFLQSRNLPLAK